MTPAPTAGQFDCRDAYVRALETLAERDPRIVAVVNDSVGSSKLGAFRDRFPDRLVNVGIAEQNMVGVGAGLPKNRVLRRRRRHRGSPSLLVGRSAWVESTRRPLSLSSGLRVGSAR